MSKLIYLTHEARDEKTSMLLEVNESHSVADVAKSVEERYATVFGGGGTNKYSVISMRLVRGKDEFALHNTDLFWNQVDVNSPIYLTCSGNVSAVVGAAVAVVPTEGVGCDDDNSVLGTTSGSAACLPPTESKVYVTVSELHGEKFLTLDTELKDLLRRILRWDGLYKAGKFKVGLPKAIASFSAVKQFFEACDASRKQILQGFHDILEAETAERREKVAEMIKSRVTCFWDLSFVFENQKVVVVNDDGLMEGFDVSGILYRETFLGLECVLTLQYVAGNGKDFVKRHKKMTIGMFAGTKNFEELPLNIATEEQIAHISERNHAIAKVCNTVHHADFNGFMSEKWGWGRIRRIHTDGRIIIDADAYAHIIDGGDDDEWGGGGGGSDVCVSELDQVIFTLSGVMPAFSLKLKKWGTISWNCVSDIQWNHGAFEALVMEDAKQKELVRGLVEQRLISGDRVSDDLIAGKGAGCIFLLYGPPGTGKTLTAEATAELLERPLYQITIAELGTNASALEKGLKAALSLASTWKAVVLIDEADNFLERRGKNDLERNAMVSVFLKLLEYYEGVMFLTTNRVARFDEAFYSRISVPIMYPDLSQTVRTLVWRNLLGSARVTLHAPLTVDTLSAFELNGREIRNCIYLAQCTAARTRKNAQVLHPEDLMVPIHMKVDFRKTMEARRE